MQLPDKINGFRAKAINDIIDYLESLQPLRSSTLLHSWTKRGIVYEIQDQGGDVYDETENAFAVTWSGNLATVQAGHCFQDGSTTYWKVAKVTGLSLSGEYCVVAVTKDIVASAAPVVEVLASDSNGFVTLTSTKLFRPLVWLKGDVGMTNYSAAGDGYIYHRGNIVFSVPLVYA